jgi:tight adherence protein B
VLNTIVRTLQSGLPLQEAMQLVASEGPEPLCGEFARIINDQFIGLTLPEACQRMAERLPFDAAEFFALIITVQAETGGSILNAMRNLTETTEANLALSEKIDVAGQEARASAMIIGSLPVIVLVMLWLIQPDFVGVLFNTRAGLVALAVGAGLMLVGTLVMREMAKFDV